MFTPTSLGDSATTHTYTPTCTFHMYTYLSVMIRLLVNITNGQRLKAHSYIHYTRRHRYVHVLSTLHALTSLRTFACTYMYIMCKCTPALVSVYIHVHVHAHKYVCVHRQVIGFISRQVGVHSPSPEPQNLISNFRKNKHVEVGGRGWNEAMCQAYHT